MKFLAAIILLLTSTIVFSQEADKKFRLGLNIAPNLSWLTEDRIETQPGKMSLGFNYGVTTDFLISNNLWFATGLNVNQFGGGIADNQSDTLNINLITVDSANVYAIDSRKYTFSSVTIPLTFKAKTKEIGYITYFGQFGVDLSYVYKARATKNLVKSGTEINELNEPNSEMDIIEDRNPILLDMNIGIGGEYNLAGNTSLLVGINYKSGILRVLNKESSILKTSNESQILADGDAATSSATWNSASLGTLTQQFKSNSIVLTVGILF
ncbi:porin family protein [bacterium]|jgi:hypothetical protein|nr:porin family protein [bacterium]